MIPHLPFFVKGFFYFFIIIGSFLCQIFRSYFVQHHEERTFITLQKIHDQIFNPPPARPKKQPILPATAGKIRARKPAVFLKKAGVIRLRRPLLQARKARFVLLHTVREMTAKKRRFAEKRKKQRAEIRPLQGFS